MNRGICWALAVAAIVAGCASAGRSPASGGGSRASARGGASSAERRFEGSPLLLAVDTIALPVNMATNHLQMPKRSGMGMREDAIYAFVIDTTGAIEMPTVSFLAPVALDLRFAICRNLRNARFVPGGTATAPVRTLSIGTGTLMSGLQQRPAQIAKVDLDPYRKAMHAESHDATIARLNAAPHC